MRLLYFTDFHLIERPDRCPVSRREGSDYLETQMAKIRAIGDVIREREVDAVLFGGDLLNRSNTSPVCMRRLSEELHRWPTLTYGIIGALGNHDLGSSGLDNLGDTWIDMLSGFGALPIRYPRQAGQMGRISCGTGPGRVEVLAYHYHAGIERNVGVSRHVPYSWQEQELLAQQGSPLTIAMVHGNIVDREVPFEAVHYEDVDLPVDLVLVSHYHTQWPGQVRVNEKGTCFIAPGALMRTSSTDADNWTPSVVLIDTVDEGCFDYEVLPLPGVKSAAEAFALDKIAERKEDEKALERLMAEIKVGQFKAANPIGVLEAMARSEGVPEAVRVKAVAAVTDALS